MFALSVPRLRRSGLAAVAALSILGLSACGSDDDGTPTAAASTNPAAQPRSGGSLVFATKDEPECFDPHVAQSDISAVVMRNVYESLVAQDADGSFKPWLASAWKVSPDFKTYRFTLRDGVTFTDGSAFDADAVKRNFDRIADPATKSKFAISLLGPYRATRVIDPQTVEVEFKQPFATFLRSASTTYLGFHSPTSIREHGSRLCAGGPDQVGTGPFRLTRYTRGQQAVLVRNEDYAWAPATATHSGPGYLDRLTFRFVPDPTVRVGSVIAKQIDAADFVPPSEHAKVERAAGLKQLSIDSPGIGYNWYLNTTSAPFSDRNLRLAVQKAFNIDAAVKAVYFGVYDRAWSPLTPSTFGYAASLKDRWGFDEAGANALLDQAGYTERDADGYRTKDGKRLSTRLLFVPQYTTEDRAALDQALQADLKKVGFELKLVPMDGAAYEPVRNAGKYGIVGFAWGGGDPDLLRTLFASDQLFDDGGNNAARLNDPQIDAWLEQAGATDDPAVRKPLYAKAQEKLIADGVTLPTGVQKRQIAVAEGVSGLTFDSNGWPLFYDVSK